MYGYDNYQKVKSLIEERRTRAEAEAEGRIASLRAESAEFCEIDRELRSTGIRLFRAICEGRDINPIRERNLALNKRRAELLVSLGYAEDYTDAKYTCRLCEDTGTTEKGLCSCFREELLKENIKSSGIGRLIEKQSFENFNLDVYEDGEQREKMARTLEAAKSFAMGIGSEDNPQNLLLIGKTGTGKTHVSTAIARVVIERGYEVLYDSVQNIISAFEHDRFKSGYGPYEPRGEKYLDCHLLILDDLGTEFTGQFTISCLYNLLNTRINKGLSTVISTNLSPTELAEKYEDRIYSRIVGCDARILPFYGKDRRLSR